MKTVRHLIYAETIRAIGFVSLGFIALFFFFDFVEELKAVNQIRALGYQIPQALLFVTCGVHSSKGNPSARCEKETALPSGPL